MKNSLQFILLFTLLLLTPIAEPDLVINRVRRRVDLSSHIVRVYSSLEVKNVGYDMCKDFKLAYSKFEGSNVALIQAYLLEGKLKRHGATLQTDPIDLTEPSNFTLYSVVLPKVLKSGEIISLGVFVIFLRLVKPVPSEGQNLVEYVDSAHFVSPYPVKVQTVIFKLPGPVKSYSKNPNPKHFKSQLKYGPFRRQPPFSSLPVALEYENNHSFAVANELVREISVTGGRSITISERYTLSSWGAIAKDGSLRTIVAKLPFGAHSVYTDALGGAVKRTISNRIEVNMPIPSYGGFKTSFTVGFILPFGYYCYNSDGRMVLNITYSSYFDEILIEKLTVKVVLPKGSEIISVATLFPSKQSVLDTIRRPMVVLDKENFVPEHNNHFQVYFDHSDFSVFKDPVVLVLMSIPIVLAGAYFFYVQTGSSILQSLHYLRKRDKLQEAMLHFRTIFCQIEMVHDLLDSYVKKLSKSEDIQSFEVSCREANQQLEELTEDLKPSLTYLHSCHEAAFILPTVEELVMKERKIQDMERMRHTTAIDLVRKRKLLKEKETQYAAQRQQRKLESLRRDVKTLLDAIGDI